MKLKKLISIVSIATAALAGIPTIYTQSALPLQAGEPVTVSAAETADEAAADAVLILEEKAAAAQSDSLEEKAITQNQRDDAAEFIFFLQEGPASASQAPASQAPTSQPVQNQTVTASRTLTVTSSAEEEEDENDTQQTKTSSQITTLKVDDYSQSYRSSVYYQRLKAVTLTGNYRADFLAVAESQLGYRESSSEPQLDGSGPGSGDYTEYGRFCKTNGTAWCSEFATWCARQAGIPTSVLGNSTSARADRFGGTYHPWSDTVYAGGSFQPRPGDLVFFAWSEASLTAAAKDHTAIFVSDDWNSDSLVVYTLDGNSGNRVQRNTRRIQNQGTGKISGGWIAGFIAPNYKDGDGTIQGTVTAPAPAKPAVPEPAEAEAPTEEPTEDAPGAPVEDAEEQTSDAPDDVVEEDPADPSEEESKENVEEQLQEEPGEPSDDQSQEVSDEAFEDQPEEPAPELSAGMADEEPLEETVQEE